MKKLLTILALSAVLGSLFMACNSNKNVQAESATTAVEVDTENTK